MICVTKIFDFELAHAIHGYEGSCRDIHGHSYKLFVSVRRKEEEHDVYLKDDGFVIDFKILKQAVIKAVVGKFDHRLILSENYLNANPSLATLPNLIRWETEPSAENILLYIKSQLEEHLPDNVELYALKLHETVSSYAEWIRN